MDNPLMIKIIVLGIYVAILFMIGIVASRRINNISDYYVGGKNMSFWAVAFSARATGESGWLLIGLTGMGAMAGYSAYWVVAGELLGVFISWQFMAKLFKRRSDSFKSISIPDYLQSHFQSQTHTLRALSASILVVFVVIYVASQIDVTGVAFNSMLGIDYQLGALIGFLIVLVYIFFGGFVAAVWSDMFQGILMFFGLVLLPIVIWFSMDHVSGITAGLNAIDPSLTQLWGRSDDWIMNAFTILGFSTIGILTRVILTDAGTDAEAVLGVGGKDVLSLITETFLPIGLVAIYVAIVLSAIMSTIDSLLILASSAITRDFYQKIFRPNVTNEKLNKISRVATLTMSFLALIIAIIMNYVSPDRQIFWVIIFGWSGIAATFCPVIILTLFWRGYSERGAIASMIAGFISVVIFKFVVQPMEGVGEYFVELDV